MEEPFFRFEKFLNFPELIHGMSLRSYGDMKFGNRKDQEVISNRRAFFRDLGVEESHVVIPRQVHGSNIVIIGKNEQGRGVLEESTAIVETDALISREKRIFLMVEVADCLPVFVYDPVLKIVGLIHAGWRGIISGIVSKVVFEFKKMGSDPENLVCGIGPGICQKHFIVKSGVLEKFRDLYPKEILFINKDGYVDLKKIIVRELENQGVPDSNIEVSKYCTACDNGIYSSYRKEGSGVMEMAAVIGVKE